MSAANQQTTHRIDAIAASGSPYRPVRPALSQVRIDDEFWAPRIAQVRDTTLAAQYAQFESTGYFEALSLNWTRTDSQPHIFWDSDIAKWIEAASYQLEVDHDADLDAQVDDMIERLAAAQQPDGYLNTYFTIVAPEERFTDLRDAHELYCAGHLIEAAVANFEATGKHRLLDVMRRYADLIDDTFGVGDGKLRGYCGHEEIELALIKLFRVTGERRYLDLARYFVEERGREPYYFALEAERRGTEGWFAREFPDRTEFPQTAREYLQAHLPVREQTEAVGHAVRATYLFSAVADLAMIDRDDEGDHGAGGDRADVGGPERDTGLADAARRVWQHATSRRMYVTGGIGSSARNEGFTSDYDLPDYDAYSETCAAIGLMLWSSRMADLDGDARYVDVLERALYNNVLAGADAGGTCFFYDNPLASRGDKHRSEWFGVACCPPNLARLLSSLGRHVYAIAADSIRVDLYIGGSIRVPVGEGRAGDGEVVLTQRSGMPWTSDVELTVSTGTPVDLELALRIPGWAAGQEVSPTLRVNGAPIDLDDVVEHGYARVRRTWRDGDRVDLTLPVTPRRVWARPEVASALGRVSIARGPLVYCAESADNPFALDSVALPASAGLIEGVPRGDGLVPIAVAADQDRPSSDALYADAPPRGVPVDLMTVPYFSWDNRAPGEMRVWMREAVQR